MRPHHAGVRVVRIAGAVGVGVVSPVRCNPVDGATLKREPADECRCVFEWLPHREAVVRQQSVVAEREPERRDDV